MKSMGLAKRALPEADAALDSIMDGDDAGHNASSEARKPAVTAHAEEDFVTDLRAAEDPFALPEDPESEPVDAQTAPEQDDVAEPVEQSGTGEEIVDDEVDDAPTSSGASHKTSSAAGISGGYPPIQTIVEWVGESREQDVVEHARGYIQDHFQSDENAWIGLAPFMGGYFLEVHEGGDGRSHLPDILDQLTINPEQMIWLPSGSKLNRAIAVGLEDGVPVISILNEKDTRLVRASGQEPVVRTGKMRPAVRKGEKTLVAGSVVAALGLLLMGSAMAFSVLTNQSIAPIPLLDVDTLPSAQTQIFAEIPDDYYLQRLEYHGAAGGDIEGNWQPSWAPVPEIVLPNDREALIATVDELIEREMQERGAVVVEQPSFPDELLPSADEIESVTVPVDQISEGDDGFDLEPTEPVNVMVEDMAADAIGTEISSDAAFEPAMDEFDLLENSEFEDLGFPESPEFMADDLSDVSDETVLPDQEEMSFEAIGEADAELDGPEPLAIDENVIDTSPLPETE